MPAAIDPQRREQARVLYLSGQSPSEIGQRLSLVPETITKWAHRGKWFADRQLINKKADEVVSKVVSIALQDRGQRVKERLVSVIEKQASLLEDEPALSRDDLRNCKEQQGLAAATKTVIESASQLFGWDDLKPTGILVIGQLRQFDDSKPEVQAIDVQSSTSQTP